MKTTTTKDNLKKVIKFIERICKKNVNLPILETTLIEAKNNHLSFSATNLEIGLIWKVLAKNEKLGKTCVQAKVFSDVISGFSENQINLETTENFLKVFSPKTEIKIKTFNPEDFPVIPTETPEFSLIFNGEILCDFFSKVVNIPSSSISTPEFTGVLVRFEGDEVIFVATDRFRLVEAKMNYKKHFEQRTDIIIPQAAVKEIINIFSKDDEIEFYFSPSQVWIKKEDKTHFEQILFTSRLISGEFPEYKEIIPKPEDYQTSAILSKEEFLSLLKLGSNFYGKLNQVNLKFLPKENQILISAQDPDVGEYKSKIEGKIEGKEVELFLNYKFLLEGVNILEGKEIKIYLIDDERPVLMKGETENLLYIVMPIKAV